MRFRKERLPLAIGLAALVVGVLGWTGLGSAAVSAVRVAFAKNAGAVDGISASRSRKAGKLLPLGRNGKFPLSAIPAGTQIVLEGPRGDRGPKGDAGPRGPQGVQGPAGQTGPQGPQGLTGSGGVPGAKGDPGPKGDQGIQGIQGLKGEKGDTGPPGVSGYEVDLGDGAFGTDTKPCPDGKFATGGGGEITGADADGVALTLSRPTIDGDGNANGWKVTAQRQSGSGSSWAVRAYVICATKS